MPWDRPVVTRLLTAVMLASVGGLLFLSSQWVRMAEASRDQATPASLEMMQLLHDEHQLIGEMVKAQLAMPDSGFLDSKPMARATPSDRVALKQDAAKKSEVQHVGYTRLDAGGRWEAAAGVPKLRQTTAGHADHAAVRGTHRPADLWLPAMRRLADGSRR